MAVRGEQGWTPRIKISGNISKITDPGRKRVVRYYNESGHPLADVLYLEGEKVQRGRIRGYDRENLFKEVIFKSDHAQELSQASVADGRIVATATPLHELRQRAAQNMAQFPDEYRRLRYPQTYTVYLSPEAAQTKQALLEAANFYRTETLATKE